VKFVSGNVQDGFIKPMKAKYGKLLAMMTISIAMDVSAHVELAVLGCIMTKIALKLH
jgi:hypothetical protein